ncbi:MAG: GxxExxY protein [Desulfohalobiaceae bacterium]
MRENIYRQLTSKIINAAMEVHRELGPGLLERIYVKCLDLELKNRGLEVRTELELPVIYKGNIISEFGYRLDLIVEDQVIVELKSVESVEPVHKKQLLTYLRLTEKDIGLLINFNEALLKDGIHRIINNQPSE